MNKKGFTLAEVLITLAIIGIVAALTIPSLSNAYQKRVMATQLQKAYAELSQAGAMAVANEMTTDFRTSKAIKENRFVRKFLSAEIGNYFASSYAFADNKNTSYNLLREVTDGSGSYSSDSTTYTCGKTKAGAAVCVNTRAYGIIDINGDNGPNIIGKDAFSIGFFPNGNVDVDYSMFLARIYHANWDMDAVDY